MRSDLLLSTALLGLSSFAYADSTAFGATEFAEWMSASPETKISGKESLPEIRRKILQRTFEWAGEYLATHAPEHDMTTDDDDYPYFNFIPQFQGGALPDGPAITWEGLCFKQNTATVKSNEDGSFTLNINSARPANLLCSDYYAFLTVFGHDFVKISEHGDHSFTWTYPDWASTSQFWDMENKGIRVHMFMNSFATSVKNVLETVLLFVPEFTQGIDKYSAERNIDFLTKYSGFSMPARDESENVVLDESDIHSGDFFGIIRLDGLDPMLAWAMGSTTGHTTVALWFEDGLHIVESTVTDSYWPTDGIQRTPWKTWLQQAKDAGFATVHVPLDEEHRAKFDTQAAIDYFYSIQGLEYGYQNMLWGWIDTLDGNYPCLPPDYSSQCLQFELFETLFALIDHAVPQIADIMWIQAMNKRLGTTGLRTADLWVESSNQGIESKALPTIVEQDDWMYTTMRYQNETTTGPSQVCCVFVCSVWKHAGLFDGLDVNCGEQTNVDDYSLAMFEDEYSQITGKYTLTLNKYNSRAPYEHMDEACPSLAPVYDRPSDC